MTKTTAMKTSILTTKPTPLNLTGRHRARELKKRSKTFLNQAGYTKLESLFIFSVPQTLGGAGGVAALQEQWFPGFVVRHVPLAETNGFHLYEIQDAHGCACGRFSKKHLCRREGERWWRYRAHHGLRSNNTSAAVVSATRSGRLGKPPWRTSAPTLDKIEVVSSSPLILISLRLSLSFFSFFHLLPQFVLIVDLPLSLWTFALINFDLLGRLLS